MDDDTVVMTVEEMIDAAIKIPGTKVNYKLVQVILHIFAQQLSMLETRVEVRLTELPPMKVVEPKIEKPTKESIQAELERETALEWERRSRSASRERSKAKRAVKREVECDTIAAEKEAMLSKKDKEEEERIISKERERAEEDEAKEKEMKVKEKRDRSHRREASKDRDKTERPPGKGDKATATEEQLGEGPSKFYFAKCGCMITEEGEIADAREKEKLTAEEKSKALEKEAVKSKAGRVTKEREKAEKAASKIPFGKCGCIVTEKDKETYEKQKEKREKEISKYVLESEKDVRGLKRQMSNWAKSTMSAKSTISGKSTIGSGQYRGKQKSTMSTLQKGRSRHFGGKSRRAIDVVTYSDFEQLEGIVQELVRLSGSVPMPEMPDNKTLRSGISKGASSLTDTMKALQASARVLAAEKGIGHMIDLLSQLEELEGFEGFCGEINELKQDIHDMAATSKMEVALKLDAEISKLYTQASEYAQGLRGLEGVVSTQDAKSRTTRKSVRIGATKSSFFSKTSLIKKYALTHPEMEQSLNDLKNDMMKTIQLTSTMTVSAADRAMITANAAAERMDKALLLDARISELNSLVSDYVEQVDGFSAGLGPQLLGLEEQIRQIRGELNLSLKQLEYANNNAETKAVMMLRERYEDSASDMWEIIHKHKDLSEMQHDVIDLLEALTRRAEVMTEQKAYRDEILDNFRDKADKCRLALLTKAGDMAVVRRQLEKRLDHSHDKFEKQNAIWVTVLKDLAGTLEDKAALAQLVEERKEVRQILAELNQNCQKIAIGAGKAKATVTTRRMGGEFLDMLPGFMNIDDQRKRPPSRRSLRSATVRLPPIERETCFVGPNRVHHCQRWVGGSHTMLSNAVTREPASPIDVVMQPTNRYTGYGMDGRLYKLEVELQSCLECNNISEEALQSPVDGGGDRVMHACT